MKTTIDNTTKLEWAFGFTIEPYDRAITYSQDELDTDEWRLPTLEEVLSIVNYDKYNPAIKLEIYELEHTVVWTQTSYARNENYIWSVDLKDGRILPKDKVNKCCVILVRSV